MPKVKAVAEKVKLYTSHMTRKFTNGHPQRLPACNFFFQYYFFITFFYKSLVSFLFKFAKFEAAKTGSGVAFLRLIAVWTLESSDLKNEISASG